MSHFYNVIKKPLLTEKGTDLKEGMNKYLFEIDDKWTIDAEQGGSVARYINHSCEPNTEAEIIDGRIVISAISNIKNGEEITIDYGDEYYDEFIRPYGCKCGATKHRL